MAFAAYFEHYITLPVPLDSCRKRSCKSSALSKFFYSDSFSIFQHCLYLFFATCAFCLLFSLFIATTLSYFISASSFAMITATMYPIFYNRFSSETSFLFNCFFKVSISLHSCSLRSDNSSFSELIPHFAILPSGFRSLKLSTYYS